MSGHPQSTNEMATTMTYKLLIILFGYLICAAGCDKSHENTESDTTRKHFKMGFTTWSF